MDTTTTYHHDVYRPEASEAAMRPDLRAYRGRIHPARLHCIGLFGGVGSGAQVIAVSPHPWPEISANASPPGMAMTSLPIADHADGCTLNTKPS